MPHPALAFSEPTGPRDAPLLVLGHSLGTSTMLWAEAVPLLSTTFRVVCWDLPGHGDSPAATGAYSIGDLADAIVGRVASDGDSFRYAGVSIAGTVGLDLAARYPDRVDAVVVVSSGPSVNAAIWADRAATVRREGTGSLVEGSSERWFAPSTREHRPDRVQRALTALADADDDSYAFACEALAGYDATDRLGEVVVPVLALSGEFDALVPEAASAAIARGVVHGRIETVAAAAHAAPLERPEAVAETLIDFFTAPLGRIAPGAGEAGARVRP